MTITVSGLRNMNPSSLQYVASSFSNAGSWFSMGQREFSSQVRDPLASGAVWSGDGQPEAVTVMKTNTTAMSVGELQMKTGMNAMLALDSALTAARIKLEEAVSYAELNEWTVNEDGTVDHLPDPERPDISGMVSITEGEIMGALLHAKTADGQARTLISRVTQGTPHYSYTASQTDLAENCALLDRAANDFALSERAYEFWQTAPVQILPEEAHEPLIAFLKEHGGTILDIASFIPAAGVFARALRLTKLINVGRKVTGAPPRNAPKKPAEPEVINPHTGEKIDVKATSESVVRHSYDKHVQKQGEYPGVTSRGQLEQVVQRTVREGERKVLPGGRVAYWRDGNVVILNPKQKDGEVGTVFRPKRGKEYFDELGDPG